MTLSRRRFILMAAGAAVLPWLPGLPGSALADETVEWRGVALGAPAKLVLQHPDRAHARRLVAACVAEVRRLEAVFSLFDPHSALSRLNAAGVLEAPPLDLVRLLDESLRLARLSDGAFDPTIQPLWRLHAAHFGGPSPDPAGPPAQAVAAARALVGWRGVTVTPERIALARPGMALSLNGIAQGYVTDCVCAVLRRGGLRHVLVHMGETRALDGPAEGGAWRIGLADRGGAVLPLTTGAVATSAPDGTRFSPTCHHLFDPASGRSARDGGPVTVLAPTATLADGLSTALSVLPENARPALLAHMPEGVAVVPANGG